MNSDRILAELSRQIPIVSEFIDALRSDGLTAWLVGGCIRDVLLGREYTDIDVVSTTDPSAWARSWAKGKGHWFWLDEQRRHSRILLTQQISFDLSPLRAATIEEDLAARDFTINALAVPIEAGGNLVDPLNGISDLRCRCLNICSAQAFADDPLRILKGARHAVLLGFEFSANSLEAMTAFAPLINRVAPERIRDELFLMLDVRDPADSLQTLDQAGVFRALLGPSESVWDSRRHRQHHQFLADRIADICQLYPMAMADLLLSQKKLFFCAEFLRMYAPGRYQENYRKLRLSKTQQQILRSLQLDIDEEWFLGVEGLTTERQLALAVEQLNPCGWQRILYHGWCQKRIGADQFMALLTAYWSLEQNGCVPHLLDGHLMARYVDHKLIGTWQLRIKRAELKGHIHCPQDALKWMRQHLPIDKN